MLAVLVPKDIQDEKILECLREAMAPFEDAVPLDGEMDVPCFCVGHEAWNECEFSELGVSNEKERCNHYKTLQEDYLQFQEATTGAEKSAVLERYWDEVRAPTDERIRARFHAHPGREKARSGCGFRRGTGIRRVGGTHHEKSGVKIGVPNHKGDLKPHEAAHIKQAIRKAGQPPGWGRGLRPFRAGGDNDVKSLRYAARMWVDEEGDVCVDFPDVGGAGQGTHGATWSEARERAQDLINGYITVCLRQDEDPVDPQDALPGGDGWEWAYPSQRVSLVA